ncbi:patatin-like phospholipase family protein [Pantoea allii]|uniref:patatin-like phospholipase family protein n=1 Tax=Pantoea allii TaxID=574096 RepID=UPI003D7A5B73
MYKLESYAVFEGGGIKGFAFTGVLDAANEAGIDFVGYAGTSAGAIIAYLASIGYSGKDIFNELKNLDFDSFASNAAGESVKSLKRVYNDWSKVEKINPDRGFFSKLDYYNKLRVKTPVLKSINNLKVVFSKLQKDRGLFSKERLVNLLANLSVAKVELKYHFPFNGTPYLSMSFKQHYEATGKDLRIVSTDVLTGRAIEFSHIDTPNICVIQAICASCAFPVFFEPTELNGYYLVDGGLSCNLPSYIFQKNKHKRLPVYAFDLISDEVENKSLRGYDFFKHLKNMVYAALDASNNIISNVAEGIAVPIKISGDINTLDLNVKSSDLNKLYDSGFFEAANFFESHKLTYLYKESSTKHDIGMLLYGRAETLLYYLGREIPVAATTKIWLYTSISATNREIISIGKWSQGVLNVQKIIKSIPINSKPSIPHSFNYVHQKDHIFNYKESDVKNLKNDCLISWVTKSRTVTCTNNKTRICFPIFQYETNEVFALISISVNSNYMDCSLIEDKTLKCSSDISLDIDKRFVIILEEFGEVVRSSLYGQQHKFTQLIR